MTTVEKEDVTAEMTDQTENSPQEEGTPPPTENATSETPSDQPAPEENWKEKYIRLYAEFENTKKRMHREQLTWYRMANKELILDLLQTLDDLERAIDNLQKDEVITEDTQKGLTLIHTNLLNSLQKKGLTLMQVEIGTEPNPQEHNILTKVNTDNEALKGKITEVVTKGYYLHEQVIRHAQVLIGT